MSIPMCAVIFFFFFLIEQTKSVNKYKKITDHFSKNNNNIQFKDAINGLSLLSYLRVHICYIYFTKCKIALF